MQECSPVTVTPQLQSSLFHIFGSAELPLQIQLCMPLSQTQSGNPGIPGEPCVRTAQCITRIQWTIPSSPLPCNPA
eukprot:1158433-Pelagomonas_calceolata.AAC.13